MDITRFFQELVVLLQLQQSKSSRSDFKKIFQPVLIIMLKYDGVVETPFQRMPNELIAVSRDFTQQRFVPLSFGCVQTEVWDGRKQEKILFCRRYNNELTSHLEE